MTRGFYVSWGDDENGVRHEVFVKALDEFEQVLDEIELAAIQAQCVYEVDLWLGKIMAEDPILVQFLVGHPKRSSLLWHDDGLTMFATGKLGDRISGGITCKRFSSTRIVAPDLMMITPSEVRDALILYLLTNSRPEFLRWTEAKQD
ncbi:MAG TPA: Imm1 family immunity protein [Trebonia sp.]|jgi:hypothetical protein|nr:Imm1 family immunity protein [Trebonia sp.]